MNHTNEHSFQIHFRACVQNIQYHHKYMMSYGRATGQLQHR